MTTTTTLHANATKGNRPWLLKSLRNKRRYPLWKEQQKQEPNNGQLSSSRPLNSDRTQPSPSTSPSSRSGQEVSYSQASGQDVTSLTSCVASPLNTDYTRERSGGLSSPDWPNKHQKPYQLKPGVYCESGTPNVSTTRRIICQTQRAPQEAPIPKRST